jgi:pimeloyl-ACP methyl ester carboxylesterase
MKEKVHLGRWRSAKSEERFRAMESALWARSGSVRPVEAIDIPTSLGPTRAYRWAGTGVPIVFLHGVSGTSLAWGAYADALPGRDVYAVDIIGDVGRSRQDVPFASSHDLGAWLDETLAALGIERAHLSGTSLGGWISLDTAIHHPGRVASLVLLDPVGIADLSMLGFMLWGLPVLFGSMLPNPFRRWIARWKRMPLLEDKAVMRMGLYGNLHHVPGFPPLRSFSDEELRSITVPVTILVGEKTEVMDADVVVQRARALLPHADVEVVAGAGHALTASHEELCASRVSHVTDATL